MKDEPDAVDVEGVDPEADAGAELASVAFEPAVPASATERAPRSPRSRPRRRTAVRRKLTSAAVLLGALGATAGAYAVFATSSGAADSSSTSVERGKQLYEVSCITCHGANLEGVVGRGVPLTGVGGAAVYFQVSTGRMPAARQEAYQPRKEAKFDDADTRALAAYVQSVGGGTEIPTGDLRGPNSSIAEGGELFRLNCAQCHGVTGHGAPLSAGKQAPALDDANDLQMMTAMLTGPESMPVFSNNQLTPDQKRAIVAYIQTLKASKDPGGNGIGRVGPVSEAIVLWVGGVGALMIVILWIGAKTE